MIPKAASFSKEQSKQLVEYVFAMNKKWDLENKFLGQLKTEEFI